MYFISNGDAKELKITGMDFEVGDDHGILVEEPDFNARQKEMGFKAEVAESIFEGIMVVKNIKFPASAPVAKAVTSGIDPDFAKAILDQANISMRENIRLITLINKLKPKS